MTLNQLLRMNDEELNQWLSNNDDDHPLWETVWNELVCRERDNNPYSPALEQPWWTYN